MGCKQWRQHNNNSTPAWPRNCYLNIQCSGGSRRLQRDKSLEDEEHSGIKTDVETVVNTPLIVKNWATSEWSSFWGDLLQIIHWRREFGSRSCSSTDPYMENTDNIHLFPPYIIFNRWFWNKAVTNKKWDQFQAIHPVLKNIK